MAFKVTTTFWENSVALCGKSRLYYFYPKEIIKQKATSTKVFTAVLGKSCKQPKCLSSLNPYGLYVAVKNYNYVHYRDEENLNIQWHYDYSHWTDNVFSGS